MKKKKFYKILGISVFFILSILVYFLYLQFFLEDEELPYIQKLASIGPVKDSSVTVKVLNYNKETCDVQYCILGDCSNELPLACEELSENEFEGEGEYKISLVFDKYMLYPFSNKRKLSSWSIVKVQDTELEKQVVSQEKYLEGIKALLNDTYLWEVASVPMNMSINSVEDFFKQKEFNMSTDYFKSLYLVKELSDKLGDSDFETIFDREIEYLNTNVEETLKVDYKFPDVYILELLQYGLDKRYLTLIDEYSPEDTVLDSEMNFVFERGPLFSAKVYSNDYIYYLQYSEYAKVLEKYDRNELAKHFSSEASSIYNNSFWGIYGLCSYARFTEDGELLEEISTVLEEVLADKEKYLIELNMRELLSCKILSEEFERPIAGLNQAFEDLLADITVTVDNKNFIIRTLSACTSTNGCDMPIYNFVLSDNLEFLLYE